MDKGRDAPVRSALVSDRRDSTDRVTDRRYCPCSVLGSFTGGMSMDRVFRFSTGGSASSYNATLGLDRELDLTPILDDLRRAGRPEVAGRPGHLWGMSDGSKLWRYDDKQLEPGDFGARLDKIGDEAVVTHLYEVLAVLDDATVPNRLGVTWRGGNAKFPVSFILGPAVAVGPVAYADMQRDFGWQPLGGNWEALFLPTSIDETTAALAATLPPRRTTRPGAPLQINGQRSEGVERKQRCRTGQQAFKSEILVEYGEMCGACDVTGRRLLDAAHLVDEGWCDDRWDIGIPLCPNHHRLFDTGILCLDAATRWTVADATYAHTLTKPDLGHLRAVPHADAIAWKAAHPVAGRYGR